MGARVRVGKGGRERVQQRCWGRGRGWGEGRGGYLGVAVPMVLTPSNCWLQRCRLCAYTRACMQARARQRAAAESGGGERRRREAAERGGGERRGLRTDACASGMGAWICWVPRGGTLDSAMRWDCGRRRKSRGRCVVAEIGSSKLMGWFPRFWRIRRDIEIAVVAGDARWRRRRCAVRQRSLQLR